MERQTDKTDDEYGLKFAHAHKQPDNVLDLVLDENVVGHVAHENAKVAEDVGPVSRKGPFNQILDFVRVLGQRALAETFRL